MNRLFLAAFGKHPGWDDHIEDLGIETEQLIHVKRTLYVEGIRGNVDSGAWDGLSEAQRLDGFDHLFLWWRASDTVLGRMWSSMDGKGRTRYPMVICAQSCGLPLPWVLKQVLPRLEGVKSRCLSTTSAPAVRSIIGDAGRGLRRLAQHTQASTEDLAVPGGTLARLADHPEMGTDHVRLLRILYKIEQGMSAGSNSGVALSARVVPGSLHIRVPACQDSPAANILLWLTFLFCVIDRSNALVLILPLGGSWVDIVAGEPTMKELFCIRASLGAIPQTTEIPYTMDPDFMDRWEQRIAASRTQGEEASSAAPNSSRRRRW